VVNELKYFLRNTEKKMASFKKKFRNVGFETIKIAYFSRRKSVKIAENTDHNIEPRLKKDKFMHQDPYSKKYFSVELW
jgi:hypothetical protein